MSKKKSKQTKDSFQYYPPEMIPFALCSACLDVVLEQSEKAADLYDEVIECLSLSGCQETMDQIGEWLPDNKSLIKELVRESGYDVNKPPNKEGFGIPYIRGLIIGGLSLIKGYANKLSPKISKGKRRKRDLVLSYCCLKYTLKRLQIKSKLVVIPKNQIVIRLVPEPSV